MAMVVTVRPMAPADREHCAEFGVEVFEVIPPTVKTQEQITLNDTIGWREKKRASFMHEFATLPGCFVAETAAAGVVGFVTAGADTAALHGYISHLGVAEGSQGLGVGRTLLEAALDWMRQQPEGLRSAGIGAVATNWTGLHLYPSVGFLEVDRSVNYAMPLGPAAPVGAPARTQRQDDPQTRPQGPAIDLSTLSQHKLDMRMDTKAVLASAPPNGSIGANAHVNDNPAVKAMMEQRQAVAAAAGALDVALYRLGPESQVAEGVPRGRIVPHMQWAESTVFPETTRDWWIYVPDQYRPNDSQPARLMVFLDGQGCE
jgi:ribosomal protein S18 acetylase RimI-like enzyme